MTQNAPIQAAAFATSTSIPINILRENGPDAQDLLFHILKTVRQNDNTKFDVRTLAASNAGMSV